MAAIPQQALDELQEVYRRLDAAMAPYRRHCTQRGTCCDFPALGHMLYVTDLEAAAMASTGQTADAAQSHAGLCPFHRDRSCGVYQQRALGCRTYYCDTTYHDERHAVYETALREVRALEARYNIAHQYQPVMMVKFEEFRNGSA